MKLVKNDSRMLLQCEYNLHALFYGQSRKRKWGKQGQMGSLCFGVNGRTRTVNISDTTCVLKKFCKSILLGCDSKLILPPPVPSSWSSSSPSFPDSQRIIFLNCESFGAVQRRRSLTCVCTGTKTVSPSRLNSTTP